MAKRDDELFKRLRAAGLRKEIARPLSDVSADARKKSVRAARAAINELRTLADELERRLPAETAAPTPAAPRSTRTTRSAASARTPAKSPATRAKPAAGAAKPAATRAKPAATRAKPATTRAKPATTRAKPAASRPAARTRRAAPASGTGNRAAIIKALGSGPLTATEVATRTGISVSTVSTTLARMSKSGDLVKAPRGYGLPG